MLKQIGVIYKTEKVIGSTNYPGANNKLQISSNKQISIFNYINFGACLCFENLMIH